MKYFSFILALALAFSLNNFIYAGKAYAGGKSAEAGQAYFVELSPLSLPIIDGNGVSQVIRMTVVMEVADDTKAGIVKNLEPRLKDAIIQDMYGVLNRKAAFEGGILQVGTIKERLNKLSKKVLGPDVVKEVLLQMVQQRPV